MLLSIRDAVADRLLPIFRAAHTHGTPLDVQDVLLRYTFDNICRIGFGVDPGCLDPSLPDIPFAVAFNEATRLRSNAGKVLPSRSTTTNK